MRPRTLASASSAHGGGVVASFRGLGDFIRFKLWSLLVATGGAFLILTGYRLIKEKQ